MKTTTYLTLGAAFLLATGAAMATPACQVAPQPVTAAIPCEIGNMTFSNFTLGGGADAANLTVTYGITNPSQTGYVVNFNDANNMTTSFTVTYTVTVDQGTFPANGNGLESIIAIGGGMQADGTTTNNAATLTKTVTAITGTGGGSLTVVQNGANTTNNGPLTGLGIKSATISDSFAFGSGGFQNISNSFLEANTAVPEPMTLSLMGLGLVGLGLLRRRTSL